ncbi:hypothetical protein CAPTEDRAFT_124196 [Capitella teleta]|uniref:BTB domain-containing protein n=1 Tax=Capitella teleta TaxID=283909 RepID=R7U895_CAPTE|nr:hypothetical protein CAPTEDRAFT_124196 [Capitella teleta]|eukprot:ELT99891.1 hypothetical protein CAPTEDRAFT_124196 [Capitella teleta]
MREAEELVDITLVFDERRVKCHKVILAGTCGFFHRMFLSECSSNEVVLKEISASTGVPLVDYLYTGHIELTTQNAQDLLAASEMLLLVTLKQNVEEFLCRHTEPTNCISHLNLARIYDLKTLLEDSRKYLHDHVTEVFNNKELHLLQEGDLVDIITANDQQEDNFRFLQKWAKSDERRTGDFVSLLQHVQLSQCCKAFLWDTVMMEELMFNKHCMKLLQEAIQADPPEQQTLAVGDAAGKIWICTDNQKWHPIQKPPAQNMFYSGCASPGGFIVSGGCLNNIRQRDCYSYDVENDRWNTLPPMPTARSHHSSLFHKGQFYVIGGRDDLNLDSVESLDTKSLEWQQHPPMPRHLYLAGVVSFSGNIFVLGGYEANYEVDVNEYDVTQRTWKQRSPMPEVCEGGSATSFGDHVYFVGGRNRSCMQFDPREDTWCLLQRPLISHHFGFSATLNKKIWICGGNNEEAIEEYSPRTDKWTILPLKMPPGRSIFMRFALRIDDFS